MAVTAASIKLRYPEFASLDDSYITLVISEAALEVNPKEWLNKTDKGITLYTAHLLSLGQTASAVTGSITSESVGELSRSYSTSSSTTSAGVGETKYGKEFLSVLKTINVSPLIF